MKLDHPALSGLGGLLATTATCGWMKTLDYKVVYYDRASDPVYPECQGQKIYICWHEYMLLPFYMRGRCNLTMLVSRHQDAEILSRAGQHMGFGVVRGSTGRGGVAAIRQILGQSRQMHLVITPDGPRGPRRRLAPGSIFLASKLRMPLVLQGLGYDRPWRARSWDRFAIPRPFSRARCVLSPDIHVPDNLDRHGLEHFRQRTEQLLTRLCSEAETWAESGLRKPGQQTIERGPLRRTAGPTSSVDSPSGPRLAPASLSEQDESGAA